MALIISDISLPITADENRLPLVVENSLKITRGAVLSYRILRISLDARKKNDIRFVYTLSVQLDKKTESHVLKRNLKNVQFQHSSNAAECKIGTKRSDHPIVVVGAGPAGLFAAYELSKYGYKPMLIERGSPMDKRALDVERFFSSGILDTESNIMFGEGGAGTFSDGKLTTRIKDERVEYILHILNQFGADDSVLVQAKPHIGTDVLRTVVKNIRDEIIRLGGTVEFNTKLIGIASQDSHITAIEVERQTGLHERIPCSSCVLAIGQGARDTYEMLHETGLALSPKSFAVGVRIEHPQELINRSQYGEFMDHPRLSAAEYRVASRSQNRGVYSFCMCPGGYVVASSSGVSEVVTNGMSYHARNGKNANSAIVVSVSPDDFKGNSPLSGMYYQQALERQAFLLGGRNYFAPCSTVGSFLGSKTASIGSVLPTYRPGIHLCDISKCMPDYISHSLREGITTFGRQIKGFDMPDAVITAIETRTSSPVRILREPDGDAINMQGLYPVGEGAGYAGGIVSAAVDGIKAAQHIISIYAPLD